MKIVNIAGARPNFVKIARLLREIQHYPDIAPILVHTGQHYDRAMSEQFFMDLGISVAHVEAGLRSFDRTMPEEINRLLTDAISDLLFVTEESGRENLLREGIDPGKIHFVGNVMIDALCAFKPRWKEFLVCGRLGLEPDRSYAVLTLHRPSNVDDPRTLMNLLEALHELARYLTVVFPVHPRVKQQFVQQGHLLRPKSGHWINRHRPMEPLPCGMERRQRGS